MESDEAEIQWLTTGPQALARMLAVIHEARQNIRLECYIIKHGEPTVQLVRELIDACKRGCKVHILADALGSAELPASFWRNLRKNGCECHIFNPLSLHRLAFRDHRKLLVCDDKIAIIGGFNIAPEYLTGDGINKGWRDLGVELTGRLVHGLANAFDDMFRKADFRHPPLARLRKAVQKTVLAPEGRILLSCPGRNSRIKHVLGTDLAKASRILIICPYFLPTWRIRREITRAARRGGLVQLILPAKTDVKLSYFAAQRFYSRLLRAGVEIYEYQPQILHAKLLVIDNTVYVGSCNLDFRSLNINYELLLRVTDPNLAEQGSTIFSKIRTLCHRIDFHSWKKSHGLFYNLKVRWAYFLLGRVDPLLARHQWRRLLANARNAKAKVTKLKRPKLCQKI